jgi:hypothetical protein
MLPEHIKASLVHCGLDSIQKLATASIDELIDKADLSREDAETVSFTTESFLRVSRPA